MAKVSTNITLDEEDKAQFQYFLAEVGLDFSTAVRIFIKQTLMQGKIPFEIKAEVPNKLTEREMEAAENGEKMVGPFNSVKELTEDLNN